MKLTRTVTFRGVPSETTGRATEYRYLLVASPRPESGEVQILVAPMTGTAPMPQQGGTFGVPGLDVEAAFAHVVAALRDLPQDRSLDLQNGG